MDDQLKKLGGERILSMGEGDELCGQDESFKEWAGNVFKVLHVVIHKPTLKLRGCTEHGWRSG